MNPARKFAPEPRIVELASISLRNERRNGITLLRGPCEFDVDTLQHGRRLEKFDDRVGHVFVDEWTTVGRAFRYCIEKFREIVELRSGIRENNACDDVRIGALRKSGDPNWYIKMGERDSQIEERGTTADDELSIERINIRQAPGTIGTNEELVTIDD